MASESDDDVQPAASAQADPQKKPFTPETLDRSLIAIPLLNVINGEGGRQALHNVIIDVNMEYSAGPQEAKAVARELVEQVEPGSLHHAKSDLTDNYLFARMSGEDVQNLARLVQERAGARAGGRAVHRIWLDQELSALTSASVATVKGIAAQNVFGASGEGIVWAVADSGIDATHPHFHTHRTLELSEPLGHADLTGEGRAEAAEAAALLDVRGHGTHVAGIIAGELIERRPKAIQRAKEIRIRCTMRKRQEDGSVIAEEFAGVERMSGVAPKTKILSLKVLNDQGTGLSSNLIAAIAYVQKLNGNGRRLRVHGLNMSVGYDFDPEWFACGQSPLCVEVNRLVKSGVSVVVAAGNTGYGWVQLSAETARTAGLDLTINDPGNADLAITVGSTHRDMPHIYGVSYFSSKGPTGDGRLKPDLVAPGEKILSCRSAQAPQEVEGEATDLRNTGRVIVGNYKEDSGTSMAAPHVSGAIAAFLSVRREFIGRPEEVKEIFLASATDLKRDRHFQGAGLLDLMRALQSV